MNSESEMHKVGFPFYPSDLKALDTHLKSLAKAGVAARRGTIVRALVCLPTATQLFAHALLLHEEQAARGGVREGENVAETIVVRVPKSQAEKLDGVVEDLAERGVSVKLAFVVRAAFRALPAGPALVAFVKQFNEKFPNRPRGAPVAKLRNAKKHG